MTVIPTQHDPAAAVQAAPAQRVRPMGRPSNLSGGTVSQQPSSIPETPPGENRLLHPDQSRTVMDGQMEAEPPQGGQARRCKVDGEKRFDKRFRKNQARAAYMAKRRAERFAARFGGAVSMDLGSANDVPAIEQQARVLVIGGLGHLGSTSIKPALEAMPGIVADCLDRGAHDKSA
jgi:hypothetical protein